MMNGHSGQQSFEDVHKTVEHAHTGSIKRRIEDGHPTRAKRNRYVSMACSECKRRKIKCNGEIPCQRCGNLSLECLYVPNCCTAGFKDSDEFRQMNDHIQSLQDQVNDLYANLNSLYQRQNNNLASSDSSNPITFPTIISSPSLRARVARFQGPTSTAFNFDVANSSLQTMGITTPEYNGDEGTPARSTPSIQAPTAHMSVHPSRDPLWAIKREEAIRLCRLYDEETGLMYPMLDIEKIITKANVFFTYLESAVKTGLQNYALPGNDAFHDEDTNILKMVLATAAIVEGNGRSELGEKLFSSVQGACQSKLWGSVSVKGLILLVLAAQFLFHLDEEAQAYRINGIAARMCFEMGLHRREVLIKTFRSGDDYSWGVKLFWSIYILDRRWSFGTGMPFAIQDADIDPLLPEPDEKTPYLSVMVAYCRISSKAWRTVNAFENIGSDIGKEDIDYLDYQIRQWQKALPEPLRYEPSDNSAGPEGPSRASRRLRILLYLRAHQLLIMIYRPVLHSATSIMENRARAQTVVDIAKENIRVLTRLNQTSDIYRTQQICFNYFLVTSLAVLFLAVSHAPVEFSRQVRDEFYQALDLVKGFSTKSYTSKRLWNTIRGLRTIGPKLGLVSRPVLTESDDPHSSAAVAMAGLAGHTVEEFGLFPQIAAQGQYSLENSPQDGQQISNELTSLFEAAGGFGQVMSTGEQGVEGMNGYVGTQVEMTQPVESMAGMFGNEEEFARIMRDLF